MQDNMNYTSPLNTDTVISDAWASEIQKIERLSRTDGIVASSFGSQSIGKYYPQCITNLNFRYLYIHRQTCSGKSSNGLVIATRVCLL